MHWIRRLHLYLGLFLFPWAVLYGFTGFLFNHPLVMSDQPLNAFGREVWTGTPMAELPPLESFAREVVESMQLRSTPESASQSKTVQLVSTEPVRYAGDFAFATLKSSTGDINLLFDAMGGGGTIRWAPATKEALPEEAFPWTVSQAAPPVGHHQTGGGGGELHAPSENPLTIPNSLVDRLNASIPALLTARALPAGEVKVTSVPDLVFVVESAGKRWRVNYNSLKGTVIGKPHFEEPQTITWRRYLIRLHLTHGYPMSTTGSRWMWVIGADAIALTLIYWGVSGLLMWWQIKSTRRWGIVCLILSSVVATTLAVGMHGVLTMNG